ncbi:MAG: hypothetical protein N2517_08485 [Ignavibacteria bacterium]|nr:hypothetical protein [Ignavibacteria bacterium]
MERAYRFQFLYELRNFISNMLRNLVWISLSPLQIYLWSFSLQIDDVNKIDKLYLTKRNESNVD